MSQVGQAESSYQVTGERDIQQRRVSGYGAGGG